MKSPLIIKLKARVLTYLDQEVDIFLNGQSLKKILKINLKKRNTIKQFRMN